MSRRTAILLFIWITALKHSDRPLKIRDQDGLGIAGTSQPSFALEASIHWAVSGGSTDGIPSFLYRQSGPGSAECPLSYTDVGGGCFRVLDEVNADYITSQEACRALGGGDLAIVNDCALLGSLANYISSLDLGSVEGLWIGGSDLAIEGEWLWLDGSPVSMGAPFWGRTHAVDFKLEPTGESGENCAAMSTGGGFYFQDINCAAYPGYSPICQTSPITGTNGACLAPFVPVGGSCLNFLPNVDLTWDDARTVCRDARGDLAIFQDCHLMTDAVDYLQKNGLNPAKGFWIGGIDADIEGTWTWINGSPMVMGTPFWGRADGGPLQPDNTDNEEDCLELLVEERFYFNDYVCSWSRTPLCQADPI